MPQCSTQPLASPYLAVLLGVLGLLALAGQLGAVQVAQAIGDLTLALAQTRALREDAARLDALAAGDPRVATLARALGRRLAGLGWSAPLAAGGAIDHGQPLGRAIDALEQRLLAAAEGQARALRTLQGLSLALTLALGALALSPLLRRRAPSDPRPEPPPAVSAGPQPSARAEDGELAATRTALELLYATGAALGEQPPTEPDLMQVLHEIDVRLGVPASTLCLCDDGSFGRGVQLISTRPGGLPSVPCWEEGCRAGILCTSGTFSLPTGSGEAWPLAAFPVSDREQRFGVLLVDLTLGARIDPGLETGQKRVLAAVAEHMGAALNLDRRMREVRRLALLEERAVIARELHDSLAQSLAYLKIQVARLAVVPEGPDGRQRRGQVQGELREGLSDAYRQLRDLLTTFRLGMDQRGLASGLTETIRELGPRGGLVIALDNRLPAALLSPNEELHVLHIVREALTNVVRHAAARHAEVRLARSQGGIEVVVEDDGRGIAPTPERPSHYGLAIMRERSASLGGELRIDPRPQGGTRVRLHFQHRAGRARVAAVTTEVGR